MLTYYQDVTVIDAIQNVTSQSVKINTTFFVNYFPVKSRRKVKRGDNASNSSLISFQKIDGRRPGGALLIVQQCCVVLFNILKFINIY